MADHKPQIPVGYWKSAVTGQLGPATWVNVFYGAVDGTGHTPGAVIAAVAAWVHQFYSVGFTLGAFDTQWSAIYQTITYRDAADSIVRLRVADAMAGTDTAATQDAQVAILINWATGDPRRGGKPRQYVCGLTDNRAADSARLTSGFQTALNTNLLSWLTSGPGLAIPLQLVEMSFRDNKTWRDAAHTYPIIGVSANPVVATQRRRVNRLRPH